MIKPNRERVVLLVSCIGGALAPKLLQSLRKSEHLDYFLVGVDANPYLDSSAEPLSLVDAFYVVPPGSSSKYEDVIFELVERHSIDFILPGSDDEAFALAKIRAQLETFGTTVLISDLAALNAISDKAKTYKHLQANNIAVPDHYLVKTEEEFFHALEQLGFPETTIICKPSSGRGGRGVYILEGNAIAPTWLGAGKREARISPVDLPHHKLMQELSKGYLIMPQLYTPAYDADVFPTHGGDLRAVIRQRVNPAGIPFAGNIFEHPDDAVDYCLAVANSLSLNGIHDIDLMTGRDGRVCLLEVNPRPSGSLAISLIAGLPIVDIVIGKSLGINIHYKEIPSGLVVSPQNL